LTRALITGLTGFVGSHLAEYLVEHTDWDVYGMTRWRSPLDNLETLIPRINAKDRVHLLCGDLRDTISIQRVVREAAPDYVFHLAAQSFPRTSFDSPLDTLDTNILGTTRLLDAVRQFCPQAIVHVCSSSEVFGRVPKDKVPIGEETLFHPASPYAISKAGTDLVGRFYAEAYGINTQTTRMFTTTGPRRGDVFMESSFSKQICMIEAGLLPPVVKVGNLDSLRTLCDVRDVAKAYHIAVTVNPIPGSYYNIGGTHTCTVGDIAHHLIRMSTADVRITIEVDPERLRPIDADLQVPDTRKFRAHTGWQPEIPFAQTMADLMAYWRDRVRKEGGRLLQR
jgi:GDPmannose 4,6-dehydratase